MQGARIEVASGRVGGWVLYERGEGRGAGDGQQQNRRWDTVRVPIQGSGYSRKTAAQTVRSAWGGAVGGEGCGVRRRCDGVCVCVSNQPAGRGQGGWAGGAPHLKGWEV